jgi:hypothetical protein
MLRKIAICSFCLLGIVQALRADQTVVTFDSGNQTVFNQTIPGTVALTGGITADGDGAVLQLGYYDQATLANSFLGNWVPLSGAGSLNTALIAGSNPSEQYNQTSIGDLNGSGAGDGTFALSLTFVQGDATSGNSLPAAGVPLSLRFYNGTSLASSTFFNAVSDDAWVWKTPLNPNTPNTVAITLDAPLLEWQSIAQGQNSNTAFHTTLAFTAVPEPSTIASVLIGSGLLGIVGVRRRRN